MHMATTGVSNAVMRAMIGALALSALLVSPARSATISYTAMNLGGSTWEYSYTVINDTLGADLEEFTIFFDVALFENLAVTNSPNDWDSLVVQPDSGIPADGFFDSLALGAPIAASDSLGEFSVSFDFLGAGTPGAQLFAVVDPITFATLESGVTISSVVPVPGGIWLLLSGLTALIGGRRAGGQSSR
jgi:hypothetical protein